MGGKGVRETAGDETPWDENDADGVAGERVGWRDVFVFVFVFVFGSDAIRGVSVGERASSVSGDETRRRSAAADARRSTRRRRCRRF
jgi:hypothetical protein